VYKTIAILLVTFAVIISAMRLMLPYAHHYRVELQDHINTRFQTDIEIGALSMDWKRSGPVLVAENVKLIKSASVEASIGKLNIDVNFWQSIKEQTLITNDLTLDKAYVYVNKPMLAQSSNRPSNQSILIDRLIDLFLLQIHRFSLTDSKVVVFEHETDKAISIGELNWLNTGERHQASGDITFDGVTTDKLNVLIDMQGRDVHYLKGQLYLSANNLNITQWLDRKLMVEHENTSSSINLTVWGDIDNGELTSLQVELGDSKVQWLTDNQPQTFQLSNGQLLLTKQSDSTFYFQSSPLTISVNKQTWQPLHIDAQLSFGGQNQAYVSQLDIAGLASIVPLFVPDMGDASLLANLSPKGQLHDIYWRLNDNKNQIAFRFADLSLNYSQGIPGFKNASGEVILDDDQVAGGITLVDSALDFDKHFKTPIAFAQLSSYFDVHWNEQGLQVNATDVEFISPSADITANIGITVPLEGDVSMSLLAQVHNADAGQAEQFYPHLLMGDNLVNYLNRAIIKGDVEQAQVLFNGPLNAFPFNQHEGIFVVDAELTQARFAFDTHWPAIDHFSANLNFTNNGMFISARDGLLSGLDVQGVTAEIRDLSDEKLLIVQAELDQQLPENITTLMQASSLQNSVGEALSQLTIHKPISGDFSLKLPLDDVDSTIASGRIVFEDNALTLKTPAMTFTQLNGELTFENEKLSTNKVELAWLGLPLSIDVSANQQEQHYQTNINIDAQWSQQKWQQHVPEPLLKYGEGALDWQGLLALNFHHNGGMSYDLAIQSNLAQASLLLPSPYNKASSQKLALSAQVHGQDKESILNIKLGEQLSFYGVLNHEDVQFSLAHLVLGNEQMLLPTDSFHITTQLDTIEVATWHPFIQDILASLPDGDSSGSPLLAAPDRIRGNVEHVNLFGQMFNDVSFNLLDQENWWLLQVNAKEARTQVKFYPDWVAQGIDIDADFIKLPYDFGTDESQTAQNVSEAENRAASAIESTTESTTESKAQQASLPIEQSETAVLTQAQQQLNKQATLALFNDIPKINFVCDDCQLGLLNLGEVSFNVSRARNNTLSLNNLKVKRGKNNLSIDGAWQHLENGEFLTSMSGRLAVHDVEREAEHFGYASIIKDSGLKSDFTLNWDGGPHQFEVAKLNGDFSAAFDDGYLADVSDKGVRILSILSLQSLVRKLTLDFRDIFSDGMFYSSIKGDTHIQDGIFYTDNMRMKGTAGDLIIKGNTSLALGELDYRMSYKPNLTSSLPVLAWIATLNPVTFLAGVAIDEVFTSQVVSEFNFELTGSINDPKLKEVNRKTRDVSVGRSTPPQFVEHNAEPSHTNNKENDPINNTPVLQDEKRDKTNG